MKFRRQRTDDNGSQVLIHFILADDYYWTGFGDFAAASRIEVG